MKAWKTGAFLVALMSSASLGADPFDPHRAFTTLCASCHTIGGGDALGPDLEDVTDRRDRAWLLAFMRSPEEMIAKGDPNARALYETFGRVMPDQSFTREELERLLDYIAAGGPATVPAEATEPDRQEIGRRLFHGLRRFENRGAACSLCHSLGADGAGASLGGSLHGPGRSYAGAELANALRYPTTPLMRSLYGDRTLTSEEAASVAAYLTARRPPEAAERPEASAAASAPLLGLLTGVLLGLFGDLTLPAGWRRR